jgi:hypothetical protein
MPRLRELIDSFNVRPMPRHFADVAPSKRPYLLRMIARYLRACEEQELKTPMHRHRVND